MSIQCFDPQVSMQASNNFIKTLNDKSIQGMIFDYDNIQVLIGDEDQENTMRSGNKSLPLEAQEKKQSNPSSLLQSQAQEKQKEYPLNDCLNVETKAMLADSSNKVLLTIQQQSELKEEQEQPPFAFELENLKNKNDFQSQLISENQSNVFATSIPESNKPISVNKSNVNEDLRARNQSVNLRNKQNTAFSNSIQNDASQLRKFNSIQNQQIEVEYCKNYEKASQIINKIFSKALSGSERVTNHIQSFIQYLTHRKNNRRMPPFQENENLLINDAAAAYKHQKQSIHSFYQEFLLCQFFISLKLHLPIPVLSPTHTLRIYCDIFQVFFTYIFLYIYSILVFFAEEEKDSLFIQQLFKLSFFVFLFDIVLNFNTAYFDKDAVITNRKKIAWKYLSSMIFLTDSLNLFIMGYKIIFLSSQLVYNPNDQLGLFFLNLLAFLKLNGISKKRNRINQVFTLKKNQKHMMRLFNQLLSVITVAHIVSLGWYTLGAYELERGYSISWIQKYDLVNLTYLEKYIYSLYWSVTTMTTVGYGDISACNYIEALFITIAMMIFSCVFAYSINNIGFILQEIEKTSKLLNDNITAMQRYLNRKNVNISLQSRVRHYLTFLAKEQNDRDQQAESDILGVLSNKLRDEITVEINTRILRNHTNFVANFSEQTLRKLVFIMEEVVISPNEIIFEEGDHDDQSIYFIESGVIEIYQLPLSRNFGKEKNRTHILQTLGKNQLFGDISFFSGLARKASARSVNLSTLYKINRNDFTELIRDFPEEFERFKMIEEKIKFQNDISALFIKCYACRMPGHIAMNCPLIHQVFDTQFQILRENFSIFQKRIHHERKNQNKRSHNPKLLVNQNSEYNYLLKENLRNYNSFTELMLQTEIEITTLKSDMRNKTSSSSSSSSCSDDSESSASSRQEDQEQDQVQEEQEEESDKFSQASPIENKSAFKIGSLYNYNSPSNNNININSNINNPTISNINEKMMGATNKPSSFRLITSKPKLGITKEQTSIKNITSFREIEYGDNLQQGEQCILQVMKKQNAQNEDNPVGQQSHSLNERQCEILMKENEERNYEETSPLPNIDGIKVSNISLQTNVIPSQPSLKIIQHQNVLEQNDEGKRDDRISKQKFNYKQKSANMNTSKLEEINENVVSSYHSIDDRQKHKSHTLQTQRNSSNELSKTPKSKKGVSKFSFEKILSSYLQTVQMDCLQSFINSSSVITKIERSLSRMEENLQSVASLKNTRSLKSMKSLKQADQISSNRRTITPPLHSQFSTLMKNKSIILEQDIDQRQLEQLQGNFNQIEGYNNIHRDSGNPNKIVQFCDQIQQQLHPHQQSSRQSQQQQQIMNKLFKLFTMSGLLGNSHHLIRDYTHLDTQNANFSKTIDRFDTFKNFKKFFPHNNLDQILHYLKLRTQSGKKKALKGRVSQSVFKSFRMRRQNIIIQNPQLLQADLQQIYLSKHQDPLSFNPQIYKPTYLSYGVSQKSESIYPKNIIKQE